LNFTFTFLILTFDFITMLSLIDRLLNKITMYRLALYYLIALVGVACIFGTIGILPYNPLELLFSVAVLLAVSLIVNNLFARTFKTQANTESAYITALILALIITPVGITNFTGIAFLFWAAVLAMASKYILAARKKHLFNPAAIAVVITAFTIGGYASWWIGGNLPMLAFVIIGGLLITRKIQRFDLVIAFFIAASASIMVTAQTGDPVSAVSKALLHAPIFFFAFVMLTEPLTTPPTHELRIAYGMIVGFLFAPAVHIGSIYSTPELALIVGNIFSYAVSPKAKYIFKLKEKREVGTDIYDFIFTSNEKVRFQPGQYMEWTLAHKKADDRGNRRYFTIASSPTERNMHLGVRFYENASTFKKRMLTMKPGDEIMGGQVAGDFLLSADTYKKIAFIAGGIGITPFRSMIQYMIDRDEKRPAILLYSNRRVAEISYREIFEEARKKLGFKTVYAITGAGETLPGEHAIKGQIDADMIRQEIPDYAKRVFYISGTRAMVSIFKKMLRDMGVKKNQIKTDFFPGFT
jgi:ferredoxin-NADP reductase/Na+-translocating ferredoxin:NAD+ oxidoreductase RnfD subunit